MRKLHWLEIFLWWTMIAYLLIGLGWAFVDEPSFRAQAWRLVPGLIIWIFLGIALDFVIEWRRK